MTMESGGGASTAQPPIAALGELNSGPGCSSRELPRADPGKLQALPLGPRAHGKDSDPGSPGSPAAAGDGPPDTGSAGELNGGAKLPNRDSGIDSPSCSVANEQFPCGESSEAGQDPTVLGPQLDGAPEGKALQEVADSDVGEGSGDEPDPETSPPGDLADPAKVGRPHVLGWRGLF